MIGEMLRRGALAVFSGLVLLALPAAANAATQVSVIHPTGLDVVLASDDGGDAEINVTRSLESGTMQTYLLVQSEGGAVAGSGCEQIASPLVACPGSFDAVLVEGKGGNDEVTLNLIYEGLPPLRGEAFGGPGNDTLEAPFDNRPIPQPETFLAGEAGNDTLAGGFGPDELLGGEGDDFLSAGGASSVPNAADLLDGGPGFDTLADGDYNRGLGDVSVTLDGLANDGEPGEGDNVSAVEKLRVVGNRVTLIGSDAAEQLSVEAKASTIDGKGGLDTLTGGAGSDAIEARDGIAEPVDCGAGTDSAQLDAGDRPTGCESINGAQVGPLGFGEKTLVTLKLASKRIPAAGPVKVRVANANPFGVSGSLSARAGKAKLKAKAFSVGAGAKKTVALKLSAALRERLAETGKLSLKLSARVHDPAGNARTVKSQLTPKLKQPQGR